MKGKDWVIVILLIIIFFLLGFGISYYVFNIRGNKTEPKQEEKIEEKKPEEKKEESKEEEKEEPKAEEIVYKFNETNEQEDLNKILKEAGYSPKELQTVAEFIDSTDKVGKSFSYNGKTIYLGCEIELTTSKPSNCKNKYENNMIIYKLNDYLFTYYLFPASGGIFSIFDKDLNKLNYGGSSDENLVINDDVFYGVHKCDGKRTDGKKLEAVEVHRFNTKEGKDYIMFYMDHNAGWAC